MRCEISLSKATSSKGARVYTECLFMLNCAAVCVYIHADMLIYFTDLNDSFGAVMPIIVSDYSVLIPSIKS